LATTRPRSRSSARPPRGMMPGSCSFREVPLRSAPEGPPRGHGARQARIHPIDVTDVITSNVRT
jgi:hypothetical protein